MARDDVSGELGARAFLFVVIDGLDLSVSPSRHALDEVTEVALVRGEPGAERTRGRAVIALPNPYISTRHATLRRSGPGWALEDSSKNGTFVNGTRVDKALLADGDFIELGGGTFLRFRSALAASDDDAGDLYASALRPRAEGLVTLMPALRRTFNEVERVARTAVPIVLRGETGTGKEVVARAAHALSRRPGDFVAVNCGAIPANLVESELFGARKGAFSGATEDRPGLVRSADKGTLLLDEIGDLPGPAQAALLRVLQEREVVPVGGTRPLKVDLRVVAASHHDLERLVAEKRFRADLEARLAGIQFELPPLRDRREDLGVLVRGIVARTLPDEHVTFDKVATRALLTHLWPKNVRELEQAVTSAAALSGALPIALAHLPAALRGRPAPAARTAGGTRPGRDELARQLDAVAGNVSALARSLGKPRKQIQRWLKHHGLDAAAFRKS